MKKIATITKRGTTCAKICRIFRRDDDRRNDFNAHFVTVICPEIVVGFVNSARRISYLTRVGQLLYKNCWQDQGFYISSPAVATISRLSSRVCKIRNMKNSAIHVAAFLLCMLQLSNAMDSKFHGKNRTSKAHSKTFHKHPNPGLISFNSEEGKFRIDWAVTIPFISIPLDHKVGEHGEIPSLLNVNTKAFSAVGLIATLFSVIMPLFSKNHPQPGGPSQFYRSGDSTQWSQMGNAMNEMVFGNNYVAPCMQRVVCSIVSVATHSDNPTSTDKIIDGLSSHKWFKDVTNGTIIQDAVKTGRNANTDCSYIYKDCLITPTLLKTMMNEFGIA